MKQAQLYDDSIDFEQNRSNGPFGDYADGAHAYKNQGEPEHYFFGVPVYSPFGIGAGPLPTPAHVAAAFNKGYDIVTLKSVRTSSWPLNPFPHVRPVTHKPTLGVADTVQVADVYSEPLAVANSFGVPSLEPRQWQDVMRESLALTKKGQVLLTALQGTARGEGREAFIQDHVQGIGMIRETGSDIIEVNLSCPNEGEATLACHDVGMTTRIVTAIRQAHPDVTFFIKLAYFPDKKVLLDLVRNTAGLVDGYSAINTMSATVTDTTGSEVFPGRPTAGVSGSPIKWAGIEMCEELNALRSALGADFKIVSLGGVTSRQDFEDYLSAGADTVMSVAGAMWNPQLAAEIKD